MALIKKLRVYVAGPIAVGNAWANVNKAMKVAERILRMGHVPFVPHMNCIWSIVIPHEEVDMKAWDEEWLKLCDFVVRIPGLSAGSESECILADRCGIPVMSIQDFEQYCSQTNQTLYKEDKGKRAVLKHDKEEARNVGSRIATKRAKGVGRS